MCDRCFICLTWLPVASVRELVRFCVFFRLLACLANGALTREMTTKCSELWWKTFYFFFVVVLDSSYNRANNRDWRLKLFSAQFLIHAHKIAHFDVSAKAYYVQSICDEARFVFRRPVNLLFRWTRNELYFFVFCSFRIGNWTELCFSSCDDAMRLLVIFGRQEQQTINNGLVEHITNFSYILFHFSVAHHVSQSINAQNSNICSRLVDRGQRSKWEKCWVRVDQEYLESLGPEFNHQRRSFESFLKWVKFQIPLRALLHRCARWVGHMRERRN